MRRIAALPLALLLALSTAVACSHEATSPGAASTAPAGSASTSASISPPGDGACGGAQCIRTIRCVAECNGAAVQIGCCSCPAGSFDDVSCPRT